MRRVEPALTAHQLGSQRPARHDLPADGTGGTALRWRSTHDKNTRGSPRNPRPRPSDADDRPCALRLCSAVLDRDVSGWHDTAQDGILIRMVRDATARSDTWRHPGAGLLIRRSQVRILLGAPQNPRSNGVREDLGRGPRCVFGRCVLLVCSPIQGEYRWGATSQSTLPSRDRAGPQSMCPRTPFNTPRPPLNPYPARGQPGAGRALSDAHRSVQHNRGDSLRVVCMPWCWDRPAHQLRTRPGLSTRPRTTPVDVRNVFSSSGSLSAFL